MDETNWFVSDYNDGWHYMDDNVPIVFKRVEYRDEEYGDEDVDDDATMNTFWNETGLESSGMEPESFAGYFESLYQGYEIDWEDENEDDEGNIITTNYFANSNGDTDTVLHPANGGTMRVAR